MGLSNFRLRLSSALPQSKSSKPSKPAKPAKPAKTRPPRRPRLKELTAEQLVDTLGAIRSPPTHDFTQALTERLVTDAPLLTSLVDLLVDPNPRADPKSDLPAFQSSWLISTLLVYGPLTLRDALASQPALLQKLLQVFQLKHGLLHPTHASYISTLLRALLHTHSKQLIQACSQPLALVRDLIRHIDIQPVAQLLPRLVGSRPFSAQRSPTSCRVALNPAHKRCLSTMASATVHARLAQAFATTAADVLDASSSDTLDSREPADMLRACAGAMAEISTRAALVDEKHEDPDERRDAMFAGNVSIVTSAKFNDARRYLDLLVSPGPMVTVIRAGLSDGAASETDVAVPALEMVTAVLQQRRASSLVDGEEMSEALREMGPLLAEALRTGGFEGGGRVGLVRLGALDCVEKMVGSLGNEECVLAGLGEGDCDVMKAVLEVGRKFGRVEVVRGKVGEIVKSVFERFDRVAQKVADYAPVVETLVEMGWDVTMDSGLQAAEEWLKQHGEEDQAQKLTECREGKQCIVGAAEEEDVWGSLRQNAKKDTVEKKETLSGECSEDFGQELYVMALLDEESKSGNGTAPSDDDIVKTAVAAEMKGWHRRRALLLSR